MLPGAGAWRSNMRTPDTVSTPPAGGSRACHGGAGFDSLRQYNGPLHGVALIPTKACHSHLGSAGGKRALRRWTELLSPLFYSPASNRKGAVSLGEEVAV